MLQRIACQHADGGARCVVRATTQSFKLRVRPPHADTCNTEHLTLVPIASSSTIPRSSTIATIAATFRCSFASSMQLSTPCRQTSKVRCNRYHELDMDREDNLSLALAPNPSNGDGTPHKVPQNIGIISVFNGFICIAKIKNVLQRKITSISSYSFKDSNLVLFYYKHSNR